MIPIFVSRLIAGEPITIYGEGKQTRSFCYVDDLVTGLIALMDCEDFTGPVNLGNPGEFTIAELANEVLSLTGSMSKLDYRPLPADDPVRRQPDISLAKAKLDWQPKIALHEGLRQTIAYFDRLLKEP